MRFNICLYLDPKSLRMSGAFVLDKTYENQDFSANRLEKGEFENCTFINCNFSNGYLDNQNFMECEFVDCDLTNANIKHSIFKETSFKGSKLVGVRFEDCNDLLLSVAFEDCNLTLASFYGLSLKGTIFNNCILVETDYTEADLTQGVFSGCKMQKAIFHQTNLHGADLSTAIEFDINPEHNQLKKTRFGKDNLIGLLKKYDIVIA